MSNIWNETSQAADYSPNLKKTYEDLIIFEREKKKLK